MPSGACTGWLRFDSFPLTEPRAEMGAERQKQARERASDPLTYLPELLRLKRIVQLFHVP
eukprot:7181590-Pyramimonas_sp.AAC.1